jgi:hypothetical protein
MNCLTDPNQLPERQSLQVSYNTWTAEVGRPAQGKKGQPGYKPRSIVQGTWSYVDEILQLTRYWDLSTEVAAAFVMSKRVTTAAGRQVRNPRDTTGTLAGVWYRESINESVKGDGTSRVTEVLVQSRPIQPIIIAIGLPG